MNSIFCSMAVGIRSMLFTNSTVVGYEELRKICDDIDIGLMDFVRFSIDDCNYIMVVDDDGLYRNLKVNELCSVLYDNPLSVIVGNAVILSDHHDPNTYALNDHEVDVFNDFCENFYRGWQTS